MKNAMQITVLMATCAVLAGLPAIAQKPPVSHAADQPAARGALVEQFFPQRLLDFEADISARYGDPPSRQSAFVAADLDRTGRPEYLVAAYTANDLGAIRVLKVVGSSAVLVDEPNLCPFGGRDPRVSLIDLDHSGNPVILVTLTAGSKGEEMQWIFTWDGNVLKSIGPEKDRRGRPCTDLFDASFIDLDGDGVQELIGSQQVSLQDLREGKPLAYHVYKLIDGAYPPSGILEYFS